MNLLRRIIFNLFVWITSILIVLYSIVFVLPNSQVHKKRLVDNDFYEKISSQIKPQTTKDKSLVQYGFSYILSNSIINDLVTPSWIQGIVEKNIDITSNWLNGSEKWELYIPTRDVEQSLQKSVDSQTKEFVDANKKEIKVCTTAQAEDIKLNGYDLSKEFCIPSEVRNGQQTLTEYLSNSSLSSATGILSKLVRGSNISEKSEIQNIDELSQGFSGNKKNVINTIIMIRDITVMIRNNVLGVMLVLIGLLLINIWLIYSTRRRFIYFIFRSSFLISFLIFMLSGSIVLFISGTGFISHIIRDFLLPGFASDEIFKIISEQLVVFAFDLVFPALVIALGFFIVGMIAWLINRFDILVPRRYKQLQPSKDSNYKTFFGSPEDSLLPKNTHEKKLELLKTYQPSNDYIMEETPQKKLQLGLPGAHKKQIHKNKSLKLIQSESIILPIEQNTSQNAPRKIQL